MQKTLIYKDSNKTIIVPPTDWKKMIVTQSLIDYFKVFYKNADVKKVKDPKGFFLFKKDEFELYTNSKIDKDINTNKFLMFILTKHYELRTREISFYYSEFLDFIYPDYAYESTENKKSQHTNCRRVILNQSKALQCKFGLRTANKNSEIIQIVEDFKELGGGVGLITLGETLFKQLMDDESCTVVSIPPKIPTLKNDKIDLIAFVLWLVLSTLSSQLFDIDNKMEGTNSNMQVGILVNHLEYLLPSINELNNDRYVEEIKEPFEAGLNLLGGIM